MVRCLILSKCQTREPTRKIDLDEEEVDDCKFVSQRETARLYILMSSLAPLNRKPGEGAGCPMTLCLPGRYNDLPRYSHFRSCRKCTAGAKPRPHSRLASNRDVFGWVRHYNIGNETKRIPFSPQSMSAENPLFRYWNYCGKSTRCCASGSAALLA